MAAQGLQFIPVTPCRVADTRNPTGTFGGPVIAAGASREFPVRQSACGSGIPANVAAYSLNVTVVPVAQLGYLTIWPSGQAQPLVSTLNSDGRVKANAAIVPAGAADQGVSVFVSDATHVIIDIDGYFVPDGTARHRCSFIRSRPAGSRTRGRLALSCMPALHNSSPFFRVPAVFRRALRRIR